MLPPQPLEKRAATDPNATKMPAPSGPPPAADAEQMIVVCPAGVGPGQQMTVTTQYGDLVVTVPQGVAEGGKFAFTLPPPPGAA